MPAAAGAILSIADLAAGLDRTDDRLIATTRASLSSMVVRMSEAAVSESTNAADVRELANALVAILVEIRRTARTAGEWPTADTIRARLRDLGVEVHDADDGTTWTVRPNRRRPEEGVTDELSGAALPRREG